MKCTVISFVAISLLWVGLAFYVAGQRHAPRSGPSAVKIEPARLFPNFRTAKVKRGDLVTVVTATGTIKPQEAVEVGAQLAGMITRLGVDVKGKRIDFRSIVHKGEPLAYVDDVIYQAQLESAEASLEKAQADLFQDQVKFEQAERDWQRAKTLVPSKAIAQSEFETIWTNYRVAKFNVDMGKATVRQCRAAQRIAEATLEHTVIRSPIDGMILDRRIDVGQAVIASSVNTPGLFLIARDLHSMQVWASVKESDINRIHLGTPVEITADAQPDATFRGNVACVRLNATRAQNGAAFTVIVNVKNSEDLLPNQTANLRFESEQRSVLLVPDDALRQPATLAGEGCGGDGPAVTTAEAKANSKTDASSGSLGAWAAHARRIWKRLFVKAGNSIHPIEVQVGNSDGSMTEVVGGNVKEGMEVVLGNLRPSNGA